MVSTAISPPSPTPTRSTTVSIKNFRGSADRRSASICGEAKLEHLLISDLSPLIQARQYHNAPTLPGLSASTPVRSPTPNSAHFKTLLVSPRRLPLNVRSRKKPTSRASPSAEPAYNSSHVVTAIKQVTRAGTCFIAAGGSDFGLGGGPADVPEAISLASIDNINEAGPTFNAESGKVFAITQVAAGDPFEPNQTIHIVVDSEVACIRLMHSGELGAAFCILACPFLLQSIDPAPVMTDADLAPAAAKLLRPEQSVASWTNLPEQRHRGWSHRHPGGFISNNDGMALIDLLKARPKTIFHVNAGFGFARVVNTLPSSLYTNTVEKKRGYTTGTPSYLTSLGLTDNLLISPTLAGIGCNVYSIASLHYQQVNNLPVPYFDVSSTLMSSPVLLAPLPSASRPRAKTGSSTTAASTSSASVAGADCNLALAFVIYMDLMEGILDVNDEEQLGLLNTVAHLSELPELCTITLPTIFETAEVQADAKAPNRPPGGIDRDNPG
ncbi:hypothetical protein BDK51DRAFT_45570 [Blyttiomyces helicus]|uniref:Uncharacterized protein n=1 Tax=Blyttiomyces helicus TaxID=388810 RepID=A0A4P9WGP0_9FUNG|nr:hypothetical protein BDK51DRAFT_45570 [Blyttiomyces helicus]|eukprot:RKO91512.1 hypothetical protein BDK51DRAFT_45570 [Blyttiomyces helicus]